MEEEMKKGDFFQKLLRKYFVENSHKVTLTMSPDESYQSQLAQQEQQKLANIEKNLSEQDKQNIRKLSEDLKTHQSKKLDLSCLPSLHLCDIPRVRGKKKFQTQTCDPRRDELHSKHSKKKKEIKKSGFGYK